MTIPELEEKLREIMSASACGAEPLGERDALEAALNVATEWQMRLDEINTEDEG